jgi:hypothetical protein
MRISFAESHLVFSFREMRRRSLWKLKMMSNKNQNIYYGFKMANFFVLVSGTSGQHVNKPESSVHHEPNHVAISCIRIPEFLYHVIITRKNCMHGRTGIVHSAPHSLNKPRACSNKVYTRIRILIQKRLHAINIWCLLLRMPLEYYYMQDAFLSLLLFESRL